jgi:hypothetical protein
MDRIYGMQSGFFEIKVGNCGEVLSGEYSRNKLRIPMSNIPLILCVFLIALHPCSDRKRFLSRRVISCIILD